MTMATDGPVISGLAYTVTEIDGHPPTGWPAASATGPSPWSGAACPTGSAAPGSTT